MKREPECPGRPEPPPPPSSSPISSSSSSPSSSPPGEEAEGGELPPVWIFGYGSLVWRPGFEFTSRKVGFIRGYSRRFWQGDTFHRGSERMVRAGAAVGGGGFGRPLARARLLTALSSCLSLTARAGGDAAGGLRGEYRAGTAWVVVPHQRLEADVGSRVLFCPAGIVRGWGCLSSSTPWPVVQLPQSGAGLLCSVSGLLLLHCSYNIPSPPCSFPFRRARGV